MSNITANLIDEVLSSFHSDSAGLPNNNETRAKELADCDTSFEAGFRLADAKMLQRCYTYGYYENSFSKWRSLFDEHSKVSLTDFKRKR